MKISILDRILLLLTGILAAYQIAIGIDGFSIIPVIFYSIGFGVLLVASLLLIILGFEVLSSPVVIILSTIIPLSLSLGLVLQHLQWLRGLYSLFVILGFLAVFITRLRPQTGKMPVLVLTLVHGIAGMIIFLLPLSVSFQGGAQPLFVLVSLGGGLIGVGGLLLSFLRASKPLLSQETILKILPGLLLLMTICFVVGFSYS